MLHGAFSFLVVKGRSHSSVGLVVAFLLLSVFFFPVCVCVCARGILSRLRYGAV